ncbi:MAG TPA: hypothetical protein VFP27_05230, partial [Mycobacterium sp.]|nr:hypothetical protein [Mycobacterium sp.]
QPSRMPTSQPLTKAFPEFATSEHLPGADHGALTDNTESGLARWQTYAEAALAELRADELIEIPAAGASGVTTPPPNFLEE